MSTAEPHRHTWREGSALSCQSCYVDCDGCGVRAVAKGRGLGGGHPYSTAVNEWICARLLGLLRSRGLAVEPLGSAVFSHSPAVLRRPGLAVDTGPWYHLAVVLEDAGPHARFCPTASDLARLCWPPWLYWFDRWVGRLDGDAAANLLLLPDGRVLPVDWEMVFPWAAAWDRTQARPVGALDVPVEQHVLAARSEAAREAIKALTDDDLWAIVCSNEIPTDALDWGRLVAYWSGLSTRRDLL